MFDEIPAGLRQVTEKSVVLLGQRPIRFEEFLDMFRVSQRAGNPCQALLVDASLAQHFSDGARRCSASLARRARDGF